MYAQPQPLAHQKPPHSHKSKAQKTWLPWLIAGGLVSLMMAFSLILLAIVFLWGNGKNEVPDGVSVAGLSIGGLSQKEAVTYLQQHIPGQVVTFIDQDRTWTLSLSQLGVMIDSEQTLQSVSENAPNTALYPYYTIDLNQAQMALFYLSELANIAPVSGNPSQAGRSLDVPVMLDRLRLNVSAELADNMMDMEMIEVAPTTTKSINTSSTATTIHKVESGQELALIARIYGVSVDDIVQANQLANPDLLYVGQELTIPAGGVYQPSAADAPPAPLTSGKAIVVSTGEQRIYAYENGTLIRSHLTSTGLPATPTVLGDYRIYVKYVATDMSGADYFLPQVPWTMYFYQGYGIHGTYWHNSFGRAMSHGCVNLPPDEAKWFFDWAEVGTLVRVI